MRLNNILKWVALCITLTGATLTSLKIMPYNVYLLNVGAFLYMIWGYRIRELNIVVVNLGLLLIYIVGVLVHHNLISFEV